MSTTIILEQPKVHPRRRAVVGVVPSLPAQSSTDQDMASALSSNTNPSLKKGATFHSPLSPPREGQDPILNVPSLPQRCPTDTKSLEAIAAGEQSRTEILDRFDLSALSSCIGDVDGSNLNPSNLSSTPPAPVLTSTDHSDAEDSSSDSELELDTQGVSVPNSKGSMNTVDVTSKHMSLDAAKLAGPSRKSIERIILLPILKEERLKPFHPLVKSIPKRIVENEITCLRDLEKTLLWLAPAFSATSASFFRFCNFTIQAIHTTVPHLSERELVRPNDRPYTNGYFLDLVTQIRQYAATVAAAREQARARGEEIPKQSKERITLVGGLAEEGRPAELVREDEDGKQISLRTGEAYDEMAYVPMKRGLSTLSAADEDVARSMARRKKNAPPMNINKKCPHCDKIFKRPCDLTKHEKTHSRPFKCPEPTCQYHVKGWPTEKERDRHVNDRHSDNPETYACPYCNYKSKRDSNRKQHMEKAHKWNYVRSKKNGKKSPSANSPTSEAAPWSDQMSAQFTTPTTPAMPTPESYGTELSTPGSGPLPSPNDPFLTSWNDQPINFNDPPVVNGADFTLFSSTNFLDDATFGMTNIQDFYDFPMDCDFTAMDVFTNQDVLFDPSFLPPKMEDPSNGFGM